MEEEIDLRVYVKVLIRSWKWIVGLALVAAVVAFVVSSLRPPTYEATALVAVTKPHYIMQFDPRFEAVDSAQPVYNAYPELATSDDLLQDLLTSLGSLPGDIETAQDLRGMLEAKSGADPSMVRLVVSSSDPEAAARIANVWAGLFVARANEIYGAHSEEQALFLEEQLERVQTELEAAAQALIEFQARNQGAVLEAQLASAQQDLEDYLIEQREIERAGRNARALQTHIAGQPADGPVTPGDDLAALVLQIQAFSVQTSRPVQSLSFGAGDDGASLIWLQVSDSAELEAGSSVQLQISDAALLSSERTVSELTAFLDALMLTLEAWEEEIETQVAALEPQILALQQRLQEIRSEEDSLTRARDVVRETHTTLAHKVDETRIAVEDTSGEVRLVSYAAVPEKPVGPRRLLNTAVAGTLGLMLGVFGAFAVEWWREDEGAGE